VILGRFEHRMYLAGSPHLHESDAQHSLKQLVHERLRLVTDAEVLHVSTHGLRYNCQGVTMPDLAEVLKSALSLSIDDRAALADQLLAGLDELEEGEAERLWAEEVRWRLEEYRAGRAVASEARDVAKKAEKLFR